MVSPPRACGPSLILAPLSCGRHASQPCAALAMKGYATPPRHHGVGGMKSLSRHFSGKPSRPFGCLVL